MAKSFTKLLQALVLTMVFITMTQGHTREIIVDEDGPALKVAKLASERYSDGDGEEFLEGGPCHMEYQVVKRVVGNCIKLGRNTRGCVAGNYLHPLHPECM